MKKILIVSATEKEIAPLLRAKGFKWNNEKKYYEAVCGGSIAAAAFITGVGIVNTIFSLLKLLQYEKFDVAINAGIAGAYNSKFKIGDVVLIEKDAFALFGNIEKDKFTSLQQLQLFDANAFPFVDGWLKPDFNFVLSNITLSKVTAVTVTAAFTDNFVQDIINKEYAADVESMEGAAFYYCCMQLGLPCVQIRAISNYCKNKAEAQWDIDKAIENLNKDLIKLIK